MSNAHLYDGATIGSNKRLRLEEVGGSEEKIEIGNMEFRGWQGDKDEEEEYRMPLRVGIEQVAPQVDYVDFLQGIDDLLSEIAGGDENMAPQRVRDQVGMPEAPGGGAPDM